MNINTCRFELKLCSYHIVQVQKSNNFVVLPLMDIDHLVDLSIYMYKL